MSILTERLDDIKELAVVTAMNTAAGAFSVVRTTNSPQALAAKEALLKLVAGEVRDDGTIVLALDWLPSIGIGPLYIGFASSWSLPQVREAMLVTLSQCAVLDGVTYDLQMTKVATTIAYSPR